MAEEIIDGTGKGYKAQVSSSNKLEVIAVTEPESRYVNNENGEVWSTTFSL